MSRNNRMDHMWRHGRLRECGYRTSVSREAIFDILSRTSEHFNTEDIYIAVHKLHPNVGLTTIYRTLEFLIRIGLFSEFDFGDGRTGFELTGGPKGKQHHHRLLCTSCNRVLDYTDFID